MMMFRCWDKYGNQNKQTNQSKACHFIFENLNYAQITEFAQQQG